MDALDRLSNAVVGIRKGAQVIEVTMDRETFVEYATAQLEKAAGEPKELARARLDLLQKNRERVAKDFSFEGTEEPALKVSVFVDDLTAKPDEKPGKMETAQPMDSAVAANLGDLGDGNPHGPPEKGDQPLVRPQAPGGTSYAAAGGEQGVAKRAPADDDGWPADLATSKVAKSDRDWGADPTALRSR